MSYFSEELIRNCYAPNVTVDQFIGLLESAKRKAEQDALVFPFSKYKGVPVAEVYARDIKYCRWFYKILSEKPDEYNNQALIDFIEELFAMDGKDLIDPKRAKIVKVTFEEAGAVMDEE